MDTPLLDITFDHNILNIISCQMAPQRGDLSEVHIKLLMLLLLLSKKRLRGVSITRGSFGAVGGKDTQGHVPLPILGCNFVVRIGLG